MRFAYKFAVFGLFYIVSFAQGSSWSAWEPCSKSCSGGVQSRFRDCTISEIELPNCTDNKLTQTRNCKNRPCSDFAKKCYQCRGSEVYCHHSQLKRNQTQDACNRHHDKCITKWFEFDTGDKEVIRGCGNDAECRVAIDKCSRKIFPYNSCHVTCCEKHYCNGGGVISIRLHDTVIILCGVFISLWLKPDLWW